MNIGFCSVKLLKFPLATATSQNISNLQLKGEEFISKLLDRRWALLDPDTKIHQISLSAASLGKTKFVKRVFPSMGDGMIEEKNHDPSFYVVRDDLLHPLVNGNKARKLDALLPLVEDYSVTDVVTCGGCQSAHATAVAVSCAERGLRSHLLLRGEQPKILTGYNLISKMYGNVTYVPRSEYANREEMLKRHADLVAGSDGSVVWFSDILDSAFTNQAVGTPNYVQSRTYKLAETGPRKVVIVNEGAGDAIALLGVIRLVKYLSQKHLFGRCESLKLTVDAGTGTTAVGLGLGALCLGLPWEVSAVMLADTEDGYREQEKRLISDFKKYFASDLVVDEELDGGVVNWVERSRPRKFGNVMEGEVEACQRIAQQTGILVDPIYTLAAWELATLLGEEEASSGGARVAMLHTGGTLGMFGLAQRMAPRQIGSEFIDLHFLSRRIKKISGSRFMVLGFEFPSSLSIFVVPTETRYP